MKRLALAAIVLSIVACSSQEETPAIDSGAAAAPAAAPAPAPAATDSAADSTLTPAMDSTAADSTHGDSTSH